MDPLHDGGGLRLPAGGAVCLLVAAVRKVAVQVYLVGIVALQVWKQIEVRD